MIIDDKLLAKLEKLSSLKIDDTKKEEVKSQLSEILNFVDNLNSIDVSQIEATFTTLSGGTRLEEDIVVNQKEIANKILANAPKSENNFFIVPKIIE